MRQSTLTQFQMHELRKSPHIERVTEAQVYFTREFKQRFYEEHLQGKIPSNILRDAGIDPEILGKSRVRSLRTVSCYQNKQLNPSPESEKQSTEAKAARGAEERIVRLEHELAYTKQELEFLKKIYLADREVQQPCEPTPLRKSSSESSEK